jgi:putative ABC transport system permease protein
LIQSFARLQSVDPGFKPRGVITAQISLPEAKYPDDPRQAAFFQRALERIRGLPGVQHAASIYPLPLSSGRFLLSFVVAGRPVPKPGEEPSAHVRFISPDYFRTMEIPTLRGRSFTEQDGINDQRVAVVNRELASRIWPGADPLGQRLTFGDPAKPTAKWMTVVGVVGDVRGSNLGNESEMELYCSQYQSPSAAAALVVRTAADPLRLVAPIRRALQEIDGDLPLDKVETMEQVVSSSLAQNRVKTVLLGIFAALALVLAAVGIYGLVSFSVAQRVHEIGIRIALGARRAEVLAMIIRQGMKLVAVGLAAGLGGAYASSRLLTDQVYKVSVVDPLTYIGVPIVLTAVALLANWLPARRATRVDPLAALRSE